MEKAIIGEKLGMTQVFKGEQMIPVTVIKAGPCVVTQLKSGETDGYEAVQLGFGDMKDQKATQPELGHLKKAGTGALRYLMEVPLDPGKYETGQKVGVDQFEEGDSTDIVGVSKGKGFAGTMKRWNFGGGPATHGGRFHRRTGAIGQCSTPARVFKGKKMPGRMGGERVTVQNLKVVEVDSEKNLILVKGAVPGPKGSVLLISDSVKSKTRTGER